MKDTMGIDYMQLSIRPIKNLRSKYKQEFNFMILKKYTICKTSGMKYYPYSRFIITHYVYNNKVNIFDIDHA